MKLSAFILIVLLFAGCVRQVTKQELEQFVVDPDNGLKQQIGKRGVLLEISVRPKDLVVAQEVGSEFSRWETVERSLDSLDYFVLTMSRNGQEIENSFVGDPTKFTSVVNYLAGGISEDITINVGDHWMELEDMIYARSFGSSAGSRILLVFKSALVKQHEDFVIVFNDSQFGTGRSEFKFRLGDVVRLPRLRREL